MPAATRKIEEAFQLMHATYGADVFDEWAIISLGDNTWKLIYYAGPRGETFRRNLPDDLKPLAETATGKVHAVGDFEFAADARGTRHDAMVRLGESTYLVCNNTKKAMDQIRATKRWLLTQRHFVMMSGMFHADPLVLGPDVA